MRLAQNTLHALYTSHVINARTVDLKDAVWQGNALGVMFFTIYSPYAPAFRFGAMLIGSGEGTVFLDFYTFFC